MVSWSNLEKLCSCSRTWMVSALACWNKWIQVATYSDRDLIHLTCHVINNGIRKVWCWTFTQHTSFYLTSYVTDMNYITRWRFFVYLYQPIHWYLSRILTFLSEQLAPFSTMVHVCIQSFPQRDHSIVTCKFQYSWRVELRRYRVAIVTAVCSVCFDMILCFLRHLAAQLKLCSQLYRYMNESQVPGISVKRSSTGTSRCECHWNCVCWLLLIFWHAFSWTCLS